MFVFTLLICFLLANKVLTETDLTLNLSERYQCDPNKIYKDNNITCICSKNGTWPNQECVSSFDSKIRSENCYPNKYVFVDCNVCLCGADGTINKNRCSQHNCVDLKKTRRSDAIVGTCDPKEFYTLEPCQFCYCVNKHKLVCNSKPKTIRINLGQYELNRCGGSLIKELSDLLPKKHQRSLKKGGKTKAKSSKHFKTKTTAILLDDHMNSIEEFKDGKDKSSSTDMKKGKKTMVNKKAQQPFKETNYDRDSSEILKETPNEESNDNSIEIQKTKNTYKIKSRITDPEQVADASGLINEKNQSHPVTIDIPSVLDKVLSLVLRKSMVSLESGHYCKSGSTIKEKCNTCFCLTNGKMLCTKNSCE